VYALNATTGAVKWIYLTMGEVYSSPAISGGYVYVGSQDGYLWVWNASTANSTGACCGWGYKLGTSVSSPAISDGVVYVGSVNDTLQGDNVYAFQGTVPSVPSSAGFAFAVIAIGVGVSAAGVGVAVAMSGRGGSEVFAYRGYYYCRKHRVPLLYINGRPWCPVEQRFLRTQ
jgi:hypothetical protein